jgi:hypothetical protein
VMGGHDLMTTKMLCRLQNRATAARSSARSGTIATSPGLASRGYGESR